MFSQRNQRDKRRSRLKKTGIKDENIDRQIWVIHSAMVDKLLAQPELAEPLFDVLKARLEQGKLGYGAWLTWHSLLEHIDDADAFRQGVLDDTPRMRKLRRATPLVGILTEQERQQALMADACGETHIDTLF